MREIKFRAWDKELSRWEVPDGLTLNGVALWEYGDGYVDDRTQEDPDLVLLQYTGLKDKNANVKVYENDIVNKNGEVIGNSYEAPELLKDSTNLLIQGFGTAAWLSTYKEAVDRGCKDSE